MKPKAAGQVFPPPPPFTFHSSCFSGVGLAGRVNIAGAQSLLGPADPTGDQA
jgi:hypothetical protein